MHNDAVDDPVTALGALVQTEVDRRMDSTLASLDAAAREPDEALLALLFRRRLALAAWLAGCLTGETGETGELAWARRPDAWLRTRLVRWLRSRNQFIDLDAAALAELEGMCRAGLAALASALVREDRASLQASLRAIDGAQRASLADLVRRRLGPAPREVASSEYTPALQLGLLGLEVGELQGPVLDVGCGVKAALVLELRARGMVAEGVDRDAELGDAEESAGAVTVGDWLQFPYGVDRWGAVISHLGFSLHLLHHHLAGRPAAYVYTEVYMQILRSLRVGGVFAYAPGLPFLERLLPREVYRSTRVEMPQSPSLRAAAADTGLVIGHATQVRRLA